MRIEKTYDRRFVVVRGDTNRPQYFSFYIDGDKSSWTKYIEQAHKHASLSSAEETVQRLRHRAQMRRDSVARMKRYEASTTKAEGR